MRRAVLLPLALLLAAGCFSRRQTAGVREPRPEGGRGGKGTYAVLTTRHGDIVVRLLPEEAPRAVENFTALAAGGKEWTDPRTGEKTRRPLYPGTRFFRVITGFIIQGGDPLDDGSGGPGYRFPDEIFPGRGFDKAGLLAMANAGPDSNGSQFFLTLAPAPFLNGKHTVFGVVVGGLEAARAVSRAPRVRLDPASGRELDRPVEPEVLEAVRIEER